MTHTPQSITCADFDAMLPDLLEDAADNALDARQRAAADAHVAHCARCRSLLGDLTDLRADAGRLPVLRPSRDLWDGISARIEAPVIALGSRNGGVRFWQRPAWLAAAAVVLMTATAGTTWTIARTVRGTTDMPSPSSRVAAAYAGDIAQLNAMVALRKPALDSATAQVLATNMRSIDDAIARVRVAVDAAPSNALLAQQLARAYDMKLSTLRLIATMQTE